MVSAWTMVFGAAFQSIASLVFEGAPHVELTWSLVAALAWQAVPAMAVAGTLWLYLLEQGEAAVATAYLFMTPAFGVFFGWLLLNERVTWTRIAGGALVAVGIYIVNQTAQRSRRTGPPTPSEAPAPSDRGTEGRVPDARSSSTHPRG
jgi:drug/metabolite transporter (DMT)-like permease